jgi:hypothetical protein
LYVVESAGGRVGISRVFTQEIQRGFTRGFSGVSPGDCGAGISGVSPQQSERNL